MKSEIRVIGKKCADCGERIGVRSCTEAYFDKYIEDWICGGCRCLAWPAGDHWRKESLRRVPRINAFMRRKVWCWDLRLRFWSWLRAREW